MQKNILVVVLLVLLCANQALAGQGWTAQEVADLPASTCREFKPLDELLLAGRGCCSWHKGQCGCEGGRVVCCDGTLSPSCRCEADTGSWEQN